jgi:hypothetical protein
MVGPAGQLRKGAFTGDKTLVKVVLPDGVTSIENGAEMCFDVVSSLCSRYGWLLSCKRLLTFSLHSHPCALVCLVVAPTQVPGTAGVSPAAAA